MQPSSGAAAQVHSGTGFALMWTSFFDHRAKDAAMTDTLVGGQPMTAATIWEGSRSSWSRVWM
ncbi:hypothetical protein Aph01nite_25240 [Acrocarpospora phusangensis]|uniref:Uncharacterized protein n=1 Tax=Acrocarpospora phusangensis TaxID=1070424 RepID=A0A919UJN0_9ACTN|nr:hypothetical protein Aph01nite_25240 [Acrocarpospora phusangensis]